MRNLLTPTELTAALDRLDGWTGDLVALHREVKCGSFRKAVDFVDAVADIAEEIDHHPDLDIRFATVRLVSSTHSAGGVTELDVLLASRIDLLVAACFDSEG